MFEFNTHVREHEWTRTCFENIEHEPIRTLIFRKVSNTYKHDRVSPRKYRTLQTWTNTNAYLKTLTLISDHDPSLFSLPESLALTAMLTSWSLILSEQLTFGGITNLTPFYIAGGHLFWDDVDGWPFGWKIFLIVRWLGRWYTLVIVRASNQEMI